MAHIPPVVNNRLLGKRVYRLIDAKTRDLIQFRSVCTMMWSGIILGFVWLWLPDSGDITVGAANALVLLTFCSMVFLRASLGLVRPQGYFNLFVAPRVIKEMGLTQRIKILFSRASFTAFGLIAASILSQGNSDWMTYWVVFVVVSYLSMFIPFANKISVQIGWVKYTALIQAFVDAKAPTYNKDAFPIRKYMRERKYSAKYSGFAGNVWDD